MKNLVALLFLLFGSLEAVAADSYTFTYGANGATRTISVPTGSNFHPMGTMTFTFYGAPCDGLPQLDRWLITRIDGVQIADWRARPFNQTDVLVRAVALTKISGGPHGATFVGNSFVNDHLVEVGTNETSQIWDVGDGAGFPFPGTLDDPGNAYFDFHSSCTGGGTAAWEMTLDYYPMPNTPLPAGTTIWNGSDKATSIVLTNNFLSAAGSGGSFGSVRANVSYSTGKYHWENLVTAATGSTSVTGFGTAAMSLTSFVGNSATSVGIQASGATSSNGFSCVAAGVSWVPGDVQTFETDLDVRQIFLEENAVKVNGGNPWCTWSGTLTLFPAWSSADAANAGTARFKASAFTTPVSVGFLPWDPN